MIDPRLRELLVCPACHGELVDGEKILTCQACKLVYPVEDDVPHLVRELARPLEPAR